MQINKEDEAIYTSPKIAECGAFREITPIGLKDCGHTILKCSACAKPLVDIWLIKPDATKEPWRIRALCCYCGDKSFIHEVHGMYNYAGIHKPHPTEEDEVIPVTDLINIRTDKNDVIEIEVKERK